MANEFVIKRGYISQGDSSITGSLVVTGGVTGSFSGSYVGDGSGLTGVGAFPFTGSALITGSLAVTGSASILAFTGSSATIFNVRNSANTFNIFETRGDITTIFRRSNNTENTLLIDGTNNYIDLFRPDGATHRGIRLFKSLSNLNSLEYYTQNSSVNGHFLFKSQPANASGYGTSSPAFVFDVGTTGVTFTAGVGRIHLGNDTPTTLQTLGLGGYTFLIKNGTAPTTSSADNFILYSADRGGTAGRASAHFRSEDGTINVLGDLSGIGTASPSARLDVRAQGGLSTDIAFRVRNSADTINLFYVTGAGGVFSHGVTGITSNIVYSSNTALQYATGTNNIAIGNGLRLHTNGSRNIAIGNNNVLDSNGNDCVAIGNAAGNGGATESTLIGSGGSGNFTRSVKVGFNAALYVAATDSIFIGNSAGSSFTGGGFNTINSQSVLIGGLSKTLANSDTNEIVIGYNSTGLGSNTSAIGNSSTTRWKLWGAGLLENITAPALSVTDNFHFYSNDITAGNAAPHFRTENGSIIKLYQQSAVTSSQGLADVLTNVGLLATGSSIATAFERLSDFQSPYHYSGNATLGTSTSSTGWIVNRIDFTTPGSPITLQGTGSWDNRTSLIYS
jgi:hypothetical protein